MCRRCLLQCIALVAVCASVGCEVPTTYPSLSGAAPGIPGGPMVVPPAPPTPTRTSYRATDGRVFEVDRGETEEQALLSSAVHDLGCAPDNVAQVAHWPSPRGVNETAFDGCGKRAIYRSGVSSPTGSPSWVYQILLVNLFELPH